MAVRRVSAGGTISYTPSGAKSAGDVVVQGELVGVCVHDLAANELGNLDIEGLFECPKETGEAKAIAAGAAVVWDAVNSRVTTVATAGKKMGVAVLAAGDSAATVIVKLTPGDAGKQAAVVAALGQTSSGTYQQAEAQATATKVDAIITSLKNAGLMASS